MNINTSRICEIVGKEVGEVFTVKNHQTELGAMVICEDGRIRYVLKDGSIGRKVSSSVLYHIMGNPEDVESVVKFTEEDLLCAQKYIERILMSLTVSRNSLGEVSVSSPYFEKGMLVGRTEFPSVSAGHTESLCDIAGVSGIRWREETDFDEGDILGFGVNLCGE